MSEEVKNAGLIVPRAMVTSYLVNGSMGLIMLVTFLFCVPSVSEATTYPYPFLYVLQSSMSLGLVNGITILLLILGMVSNIDASASASRQAFALARDRGLPFSRWISTVISYSSFNFSSSSLIWKILGSSKASSSGQCRRTHLCNHHVTLLDQHRFRNRLDRDHFVATLFSDDELRALHRLCVLSTVKASRNVA